MEVVIVFYVVVLIVILISMWMMFEKAGEPAWASIVPIYNLIVLCRIAGKPETYWLLTLIPFVGIYFSIVLLVDLAKSFGKEGGFFVLLIFLPFIGYPMLGFGADYIGPGGKRRRGISRRSRDDDYGDDDEYDRPRKGSRRDEEDDDYDDRPRKRGRRDDEDDDDDRPRKRSRRDEDDEDDRPIKRKY